MICAVIQSRKLKFKLPRLIFVPDIECQNNQKFVKLVSRETLSTMIQAERFEAESSTADK
jgi:hypothetical protein